jgi:hypothetical protein
MIISSQTVCLVTNKVNEMATLQQLEESTNVWGDIGSLSMSGACNAAETLLEQGKPRPDKWEIYPEYEIYWAGSIRSLLSDDEHSKEVVNYFASIGITA